MISAVWRLIMCLVVLVQSISVHGKDQQEISDLSTASGKRAVPEISPLLLAHIVLMSVAFCFFMPLGVFFAVFRFHPKWWFSFHWTFIGLAAVCGVAGFIVVVIEVSLRGVSQFVAIEGSPTLGTHPMLGLIGMVLVVVQIVLGVATNYWWSYRTLHNIADVPLIARFHHLLGRLIVLTSIVLIFLGIKEAVLADWVYGVYGGYYAALFVVAIVMHTIMPLSEWRTLFYREKQIVVSSVPGAAIMDVQLQDPIRV